MRVGLHVSISQGLASAVKKAHSLGAETMQIYTANKIKWVFDYVPWPDKEIAEWEQSLHECKIADILVHAGFLLNFANKTDVFEASVKALKAEINRCKQIKATYLNLHPGSHGGLGVDFGIENVVRGIKLVSRELYGDASPLLLIENMAGQGNLLCDNFVDLGALVHQLAAIVPVGVCLDTCHLFAAGYDFLSVAKLDSLLNEFDKHVGLNFLKCLHVNDSVFAQGEKKDRHASLGKGLMGPNVFKFIMQNYKLCYINKYLETPCVDDGLEWAKEIALLKSYRIGI